MPGKSSRATFITPSLHVKRLDNNQSFPDNPLFHTSLGHALEALSICLVNLGNLVIILFELLNYLSCVKLTIASPRLDNFGLLF